MRPAERPAQTPDARAAPPAPAGSTPVSRRASPAPGAPAGRADPAPAPAGAAPTTGTLHIRSDVPDTSVFLDRVFLGTAPVTARDVAAGPHTLLLSAPGYDAVSDAIEVAPGERDVPISLKEIRLDAKIPVVHKHTFGSCTGTLGATPRGLTYSTTHGEDAFTVPLTDLETFEVDYLKNNLRVKIQNGKTYNFADPDEHRDRLFVFHRDVAKVRERLRSRSLS